MHTTPATLLERLREPGQERAWDRLVELYTPMLVGWARRCGESDADAADLVQEVFIALLAALPTFQHTAGSFRRWLKTTLLNKLRDRKRRDARLGSALAQLAQTGVMPDHAERFWEAEYQRELTQRALRLMQAEFQPTTWKAWWESVVVGRPPDEVARQLGITENAVYIARCRVLRRLRQELNGLLE